jgi:plasmid stability protein
MTAKAGESQREAGRGGGPGLIGVHQAAGSWHAVIRGNDSIRNPLVVTLTVRNLEDDIVRRSRLPAAEHGRSAEAEHREILRTILTAGDQRLAREQAAERLTEFRRRTGGRGSQRGTELLNEARTGRMRALLGEAEEN